MSIDAEIIQFTNLVTMGVVTLNMDLRIPIDKERGLLKQQGSNRKPSSGLQVIHGDILIKEC